MREGSLFFRCVGVRRRPFWRGAIFRVSSAYARTCVLRIRLRAALCRRGLHTRRLGRPVAEGDAGDVSRYWRCQYALWLRLCAHVRFAHTAPRGAMSSRAPYAPPWSPCRRGRCGRRFALLALPIRALAPPMRARAFCAYGSARRYVAAGSIRAAQVGFCFAIRRPFGEFQAPKKAPNPRPTPLAVPAPKPVGALGGANEKKEKKI